MRFAVCLAPDNPTDKIYNIFDVYFRNNIRILFLAKPNSDHQSYKQIENFYSNFKYLTIDEQNRLYPELFESVDDECISRINIGILYAYANSCEIVFLVDLDYGTEINYLFEKLAVKNYLNTKINADIYNTNDYIFDPYQPTTSNQIWHRGFPWEKLICRNYFIKEKNFSICPLVQAFLINGSADVDNLGKIFFQPDVNFSMYTPFTSNASMPFNCKNTLIHRDAIPYYFVFPSLGNIGDIFGSYIYQLYHKQTVLYCHPTVTRFKNNISNLTELNQDIKDQQIIAEFLNSPQKYIDILPNNSLISLEKYRKNFPEVNF